VEWSESFSSFMCMCRLRSCFLILLVGLFSLAMPFAMIVSYCIPARTHTMSCTMYLPCPYPFNDECLPRQASRNPTKRFIWVGRDISLLFP
jgi:hypothetical protein